MFERKKGDKYTEQVLHRLPLVGYRDVWWFIGKWFLRLGQGEGLAAVPMRIATFSIVAVMGLKIFGVGDDVIASVIGVLVVSVAVLYMGLGTWNERRGFWKVTNRISTSKLNPFFEDMNNNILCIGEEVRELNDSCEKKQTRKRKKR